MVRAIKYDVTAEARLRYESLALAPTSSPEANVLMKDMFYKIEKTLQL